MSASLVIEWRDIPDLPGYQASSLGQIRSLPRLDNLGRQHKGRTLREAVSRDGYSAVRCSVAGAQGYQRVHHLVLSAFGQARPAEDSQARHLNGNSLDNSIENLRWGSFWDNRHDRIFHQANPGVRAPESWENYRVDSERQVR